MIKEFKEFFQPYQPSIRIGETVPSNNTNLAFIDLPKLQKTKTVQVFDYSSKIPQNSIPLHKLEETMYVGNNGVLMHSSGKKGVPINNLLITNVYKEESKQQFVPLFYRTELRFKHYEQSPVTMPQENGGYYTGKNIVILENNVPTNKAYLIKLTKDSNRDTYSVTIFSEFTSSEDVTYSVKYTKFINYIEATNEYKYDATFEETLKSYPLYVNLGEGQEAIDRLLEVPFSFATNKNSEDFYEIHTSAARTVYKSRTPKIFRWRVIKNGIEKTPWKQESLFSKNSLHEIELNNYNGDPLYFIQGSKAKKLLGYDIKNLFTSQASDDSEFSFMYEVWDVAEKNWKADQGSLLTDFSPSGTGPVYIWTADGIDTGPANTSSSAKAIEFPNTTVPITIEGFMTESQLEYIPPKNINVCTLSRGASISISGLGNYPLSNSWSNAINGVTSPYFGGMNNTDHSFFAKSNHSVYPPEDPISVRITLPDNGLSPYEISDIDVILGKEGTINWIQALNSAGEIIASETADGLVLYKDTVLEKADLLSINRRYKWNLPSKMAVKEIKISLSPSIWKSRDFWFIFNIFGLRDRYRSGIELVQVNAWHREPGSETLLDWPGALTTYTVNTSKNAPYSRKFIDILSELDIIPPESINPSLIRYRVMIGDGSEGATHEYRNLASVSFKAAPEGKYVLDDIEDSAYPSKMNNQYKQDFLDISYSSLLDSDVYLYAETDDHSLTISQRFSIKTQTGSSISFKPIKDIDPTNIWGLNINNGRFVIKDFVSGVLKDYFIPEFGLQPFAPEFPYKEVVGEQVQFVKENQVRLVNAPLSVSTEKGLPLRKSLAVYKESELNKPIDEKTLIAIKDWNIYTGDIYLSVEIDSSERVYADYLYEETSYHYKGFYDRDLNHFYYLDLNPMPGHKYTDLTSKELRDSVELFTKDIYLYIIPAYTINMRVDPLPEDRTELSDDYIKSASGSTLRHLIVEANTLESDILSLLPEDAVLLGKILVRKNLASNSPVVIDTRQRGGGFKQDVPLSVINSLVDNSGHIWDIKSWDGDPYPSNGVVIIDLPKSILESYSEVEVKQIVEKYIPFGVYAIISYDA